MRIYNLEKLTTIILDGFNEKYIVEFANHKKIRIKLNDYNEDELNNFLSLMISRSKNGVVISENIRRDLKTAFAISAIEDI